MSNLETILQLLLYNLRRLVQQILHRFNGLMNIPIHS